jgi:hypothetical protein
LIRLHVAAQRQHRAMQRACAHSRKSRAHHLGNHSRQGTLAQAREPGAGGAHVEAAAALGQCTLRSGPRSPTARAVGAGGQRSMDAGVSEAEARAAGGDLETTSRYQWTVAFDTAHVLPKLDQSLGREGRRLRRHPAGRAVANCHAPRRTRLDIESVYAGPVRRRQRKRSFNNVLSRVETLWLTYLWTSRVARAFWSRGWVPRGVWALIPRVVIGPPRRVCAFLARGVSWG